VRAKKNTSLVTSVILISHASTPALRRAAFPVDESIDASARDKAAKLGLALRLRRAWTGPELRTIETARALALEPVIELALRDCDYGRWTGRPLAEVQEAEPAAIGDWLSDPGAAPHDGESICAVLARVAHWLNTLLEEPGRFAAVTHPAVVRAAIIHAIGAHARSFWRIDVAPLTVTVLSRCDGRWTLRSSGSPLRGTKI